MRILLWYWGRRGGGAQYALCLAQALARRPDVRLGLSLAEPLHLLDACRRDHGDGGVRRREQTGDRNQGDGKNEQDDVQSIHRPGSLPPG